MQQMKYLYIEHYIFRTPFTNDSCSPKRLKQNQLNLEKITTSQSMQKTSPLKICNFVTKIFNPPGPWVLVTYFILNMLLMAITNYNFFKTTEMSDSPCNKS